VHPSGPGKDAFLAALDDKCVKGLYVNAHGCQYEKQSMILMGPSNPIDWVTPADIKMHVAQHPLKLVCIRACKQHVQDWITELGVAPENLFLPEYTDPRGGDDARGYILRFA